MNLGFLVKFHTLRDDFRFELYDCVNKVEYQVKIKCSLSTRGISFKILFRIMPKSRKLENFMEKLRNKNHHFFPC